MMRYIVVFMVLFLSLFIYGCDNLSGSFSQCPSIPLELGNNYVEMKEINGWTITSGSSVESGLPESPARVLGCHMGNIESQNSNYFYCGECGVVGIMTKQELKSDGTLGPLIKKNFYNIYDSDKKFVKTVCFTDAKPCVNGFLEPERETGVTIKQIYSK